MRKSSTRQDFIEMPSIVSAPAITTTLPNGMVGKAYGETLAATSDGPIAWSLAGGALPGDFTLTSGGVISGTPLAATSTTIPAPALWEASAQRGWPCSLRWDA